MNIDLFKAFYEERQLSEASFQFDLDVMRSLETYIKDKHQLTLEELTINQLDGFIEQLVLQEKNQTKVFVAMMRYFKFTKQHDLYIRLTNYTGALDVIGSIYHKMEKVIGSKRAQMIIKEFPIPVLGTHIIKLNQFTEQLVESIRLNCTESEMKRILTDNHHLIPKEAFAQERLIYEASASLEDYLKDLHMRKIEELKAFFEKDQVWFEQIMTQDVIDFVRNNPEIMSGVLKDDALYITKIPYDTNAYIKAESDQMRSYHACHCPFAKASILEKGIHIDANWCYCSAGFTKLPFEVALNQELPIECISTALKGDPLCRFKIDLSHVSYKK